MPKVIGSGRRLCLALCLASLANISQGQIELLSNSVPQQVFSGGSRSIAASFRNSGEAEVELPVQYRLYQASSATLLPISKPTEWKTLHLLPGQTVLETVSLDVPAIRGETTFYIRWFSGQKQIGGTRLEVFSEDLLQRLGPLAGENGLGLIDPEKQLAPALGKVATKQISDADELNNCPNTLFVVVPSKAEHAISGLKSAIKHKAETGCGIVWLQTGNVARGWPATYVVPEGSGRIVVSPASGVKAMGESPHAQVTLLWLCELAAGRTKLDLPAEGE